MQVFLVLWGTAQANLSPILNVFPAQHLLQARVSSPAPLDVECTVPPHKRGTSSCQHLLHFPYQLAGRGRIKGILTASLFLHRRNRIYKSTLQFARQKRDLSFISGKDLTDVYFVPHQGWNPHYLILLGTYSVLVKDKELCKY